MSDRRSVAERYAGAVSADRLVLDPRTTSEADVLVAAGWNSDGIGATLMRLRREADNARGNLSREERSLQTMRNGLAALRAIAQTDDDQAMMAQAAAEIAEEAERMRCLAMVSMPSMRSAVPVLERMAGNIASAMRFGPPAEVQAITYRVIVLWLDQVCAQCGGTGAVGAFGGVRHICAMPPHGCSGSGRRPLQFSGAARSQEFGERLWDEINRRVGVAASHMRALLEDRQ